MESPESLLFKVIDLQFPQRIEVFYSDKDFIVHKFSYEGDKYLSLVKEKVTVVNINPGTRVQKIYFEENSRTIEEINSLRRNPDPLDPVILKEIGRGSDRCSNLTARWCERPSFSKHCPDFPVRIVEENSYDRKKNCPSK